MLEIRTLSTLARFSSEQMAKVNLFASPRLFCDLNCLRPGQEQSPHRHDDSDKIYVVLTGDAVATIGDEQASLAAGQAVLASPGVRHGIANRSDADTVVLVFMTPKPGRQPEQP